MCSSALYSNLSEGVETFRVSGVTVNLPIFWKATTYSSFTDKPSLSIMSYSTPSKILSTVPTLVIDDLALPLLITNLCPANNPSVVTSKFVSSVPSNTFEALFDVTISGRLSIVN